MAYSKDFSVISTVSPWVDADFTYMNASTFQIADGMLRYGEYVDGNPAAFIEQEATEDLLSITIAIGETASIVDGACAFIADSGGDGYLLIINDTAIRAHSVIAFSIDFEDPSVWESATNVHGDSFQLEVSFSGGTNTITARKGVTDIGSFTDTVHVGKAFNAGLRFSPDDTANGGILSVSTAGFGEEVVVTPGIVITDIYAPNSDSLLADEADVPAWVYNTAGGTLLWSGTVDIVGGDTSIVDPDVGALDDSVFVILRYIDIDDNEIVYAGTETVVDTAE